MSLITLSSRSLLNLSFSVCPTCYELSNYLKLHQLWQGDHKMLFPDLNWKLQGQEYEWSRNWRSLIICTSAWGRHSHFTPLIKKPPPPKRKARAMRWHLIVIQRSKITFEKSNQKKKNRNKTCWNKKPCLKTVDTVWLKPKTSPVFFYFNQIKYNEIYFHNVCIKATSSGQAGVDPQLHRTMKRRGSGSRHHCSRPTASANSALC